MVPELVEGVCLGPADGNTEPDWLRRREAANPNPDPPTWKWKLVDLSVPVLQAWSCTGGGALTEAVPPPWAGLLMLSAHHSAAVTTPPDGMWELLIPAGRLHPGLSAAAAPPPRVEVGRSSGVFLLVALEVKLNDEATPPDARLLLQTERLLLVARQRSPGSAAAADPDPSGFLEPRQRQSDVGYRNNPESL